MSGRLECYGTANTSDCCMQCPDNEECVKETMKRWIQKEKGRVHVYPTKEKPK